MFGRIKKIFSSALVGSFMLFGCGDDECNNPEKVYGLSSQSYVSAERSSELNLSKGILVGETVTAVISMYEYKASGYSVPNSYRVYCNVKDNDLPLEFFLSKSYADGNYEFISEGPNSPSLGGHSVILRPKDLEGVVGFTCGIHIPEEWECDYSNSCWVVQQREFLGVAKAGLQDLGNKCFDWYYEDGYHDY